MDRETIAIETPVDKHKVVLKMWITGREKRDLRKPFLDGMKFSVGETTPKLEDLKPGELMERAENIAIETIVVSVDGNTEKKVDAVLDMKEKDYDFVINEINKISQERNFPKPKQKP